MLAAALAGMLAPGLAAAQAHGDAGQDAADTADSPSPWDVTVGLGAAVRPTYEGSDEYETIPAPWLNVTYNDWLSFGPDGLNAYWHTGNLRIGGGVAAYSGRDDSDSGSNIFKQGDDRLKGLGELEGSTAVRVFAAYQWGRVNISGSVAQSVEDSEKDDPLVAGVRADIGASIPFKITDKLTLTAAVGATWADDEYTQALFGVTPEQAARSNFTAYKAESGLKSVDIAFGASYQLDEHWFVMTLLQGERLTGDAADSPIVFSENNASFIATVNYHF